MLNPFGTSFMWPENDTRAKGSMTEPRILTVGHSNHDLAKFIGLIEGARVSLIADVRSRPVSRFVPHFNAKPLEATLAGHGISYLFLGREWRTARRSRAHEERQAGLR